jgi:hypothetical protein
MVTQDPVSTARFGYMYAIGLHPLLYFCNTNRQSKVTSVRFIWRVRNKVAMYIYYLYHVCLPACQIWRTVQRICSWNLILQGFTKICWYVAICITIGDSSLNAVARTSFAGSSHNFGMRLSNTTVLVQLKLLYMNTHTHLQLKVQNVCHRRNQSEQKNTH